MSNGEQALVGVVVVVAGLLLTWVPEDDFRITAILFCSAYTAILLTLKTLWP